MGFTVLAALTFFDVFKAGASYYGISNLETLATDTHKFEARYLDRLVAPYPAEKQPYYDRSPINFVEKTLNADYFFSRERKIKWFCRIRRKKMVNALRA